MTFDDFFQRTTGKEFRPYDYQRRLGEIACESRLISVPTGLGKTAAVVLAWLWNRVVLKREDWPRRLIYCLPMRTLVDQTVSEARKWIENLPKENAADQVKAVVLMGGGEKGVSEKDEWDLYPEKDVIVVGTQDMLISRALNRGYGMSRYRWPMHFGLLNNDALWVMDETQLMGVTVETSAQLDGFRHFPAWPANQGCSTWWMSATLDNSRLETVDHPEPEGGWKRLELSDEERTSGPVRQLYEAKKAVEKSTFVLNSTEKGNHAKSLAAIIKARHVEGTLTLVVVNRVARARELYAVLKKSGIDPEKLALIHSRFRPQDRARHTALLYGDENGDGDRIVIATQAVEAGVDVSARLLITELAPWSSLVQRIGRCNRRGRDNDFAKVLWIDVQPKDEKDDLALPYSKDELDQARSALSTLTDAGPQSLKGVTVPEKAVVRPVIRRKDLIDLFDTTPDICGQDIDVSRYIRDGEDSDVQLYWRSVPAGEPPSPEASEPDRNELCRVSVGDARKFFEKKDKVRVWRWKPLDEEWDHKVGRPIPGSVYLVDAASGGYDNDKGWTGDPKDVPIPHAPAKEEGAETDGQSRDSLTFERRWQTIASHTGDVLRHLEKILDNLGLPERETLLKAALWHDVGKAHPVFQRSLRHGSHQPDDRDGLYAKSKNGWSPNAIPAERAGFRHELASALAWLRAEPANTLEGNLTAYLIAAHHGKVRLSIRSLPDEKGDPAQPGRLYARGIWNGDELPPVSLGSLTTQALTLDLSCMQMGESIEHHPSWLARMVELRDRIGPFHLAFLETVLRAADARGSQMPTSP